jgi:hypothetical protein
VTRPATHRPTRLLALYLALLILGGCIQPALPSPALAPLSTLQPSETAPTLDDLWVGRAHFVLEKQATGLPMGESDTVLLSDGSLRSYIHASAQSAGVHDQCGVPVPFPGCMVILSSNDGGFHFHPISDSDAPICQFECRQCPCTSRYDHIDQQQYPRVAVAQSANHAPIWLLVYEYRANIFLRRSQDGLHWGEPEEIPLTGIWQKWLMPCRSEESVGTHPHTPDAFDCLVGSPPGIYIDNQAEPPELYVFVGLGQNPGAMGCLRGPIHQPASLLRKCDHNPLFTGADDYGPLDTTGQTANTYFDFRTISSAEVVQVGDRYYMFYEGVRGPSPGDAGDTQFALGLARSLTSALDGPWERYPHNPILIDLPGNVGVGHADFVQMDGESLLYTSLDGQTRSRLRLAWK